MKMIRVERCDGKCGSMIEGRANLLPGPNGCWCIKLNKWVDGSKLDPNCPLEDALESKVIVKCHKCNDTGVIEYYFDAGDHFGAGKAPGSEWRTEKCDCKK